MFKKLNNIKTKQKSPNYVKRFWISFLMIQISMIILMFTISNNILRIAMLGSIGFFTGICVICMRKIIMDED